MIHPRIPVIKTEIKQSKNMKKKLFFFASLLMLSLSACDEDEPYNYDDFEPWWVCADPYSCFLAGYLSYSSTVESNVLIIERHFPKLTSETGKVDAVVVPDSLLNIIDGNRSGIGFFDHLTPESWEHYHSGSCIETDDTIFYIPTNPISYMLYGKRSS